MAKTGDVFSSTVSEDGFIVLAAAGDVMIVQWFSTSYISVLFRKVEGWRKL